ncbi:MAG: PhoX family phosphatase [Thermodesulfobacteriota bacterium]|jgi:secreted PhoX family phosphatase
MSWSIRGKGETRAGEAFQDILARRVARRSFLKGAFVGGPLLVIGSSLLRPRDSEANDYRDTLQFRPVALDDQDRVLVPDGYGAQVLIRWGDPLFVGAPAFDVHNQNPAAQVRQFGFNCDYVGFCPLPHHRSRNSRQGLLVVNHEYTTPGDMFPGYAQGSPTRNQVDVELAAHGVSVVEVERHPQRGWQYNQKSRFTRRITGETEIEITGPAAGHPLLQVSYDPSGTRVRGTLNNCAGGKTLWGTILTCEENFNQYFANRNLVADPVAQAIHTRYGLPGGASDRRWENFHDRFNLAVEPNEPFRFGWVVEIDPYDPNWVPKKRTALGRFKHEGATLTLARDGRVAVYSGDDERFDYMYKFVSRRGIRPRREENFDLLDEGTLYVAKFRDDGTGEWIPLIGGHGPLAAWSREEVLINTRGAADLVGGTKMDRPEDIETNPANGKVYCVFTNNTRRGVGANPGPDAANPRANNRHGHIIELTEGRNDPAAETFTWEIFMLCGDPGNPTDAPVFFAGFDPAQVSPISSPDNIVFDRRGNLWVATDGQPSTFKKNDGLYAVPVEGEDRGFLRQFLSVPVGAETCGPEFTPDNHTLFVAVQHPGEDGGLANPASRWPDGDIARPSVIAVTKIGRGSPVIGG